jgi:uncharacterized hydrophobic protein (TIGR00271 family)
MRDDARSPVPPPPGSFRRSPLHALADRIAALFGITSEDRDSTIAAMLEGSHRTPASYWLQLLTAMGIATLGLALDSTAVVIGAMLVAPLMTPIVTLGMGLAIGSPMLVVRSAARVGASLVVVPISAAAVTLVLPVHELTSEISARTSPTVLDLAIACCCAIAGVYSAIRPGAATASTAAGTAIGIALVPPLCVVGYGLGTSSLHVAGGAALLFVANFCAILLLSVLGFTALGYASAPVVALERSHAEAVEPTTLTSRIARRLSAFFASKAGPLVRIVMPLLLVIIVYVPLRRALEQVTWEVRVRTAVNHALRSLPGETVQSSVHIERRTVTVRVVAIEQGTKAVELRRLLLARIDEAAPGANATVEITAVPDARALARAEAALRDRAPATVAPGPESAASGDLDVARAAIERVLTSWPNEQAGRLSSWRIVFADADAGAAPGAQATFVEVVHLGAPLGQAATSILAQSLSSAVDSPVTVRDIALDPAPIEAAEDDGERWLIRATHAMTMASSSAGDADAPFVCITVAEKTPRTARVAAAVRSSPLFTSPRVSIQRGASWSLRQSVAACTATTDAGALDGGALDAAAFDGGDAGDTAP